MNDERTVRAISESGLTIYDSLENRPDLFLKTEQIERILNTALRGEVLPPPLRSRSKLANQKICAALGYPVPTSFRRTEPRFPGQNFDKYVQKANNLQIWNQEVEATRRYVLIRLDDDDVVVRVRVVTGDIIAALDTTGTLTHKYQARSQNPVKKSCLVSPLDTPHFREALARQSTLLRIQDVYDRLHPLVATTVPDPGVDQERNRGGALHRIVCERLNSTGLDTGQFPDIIDQVLEVKLQTASTIDLGLVCPDHTDPILALPQFRHCDTRYAVFYGSTDGRTVRLDQLILTTGADFFSFFVRFEGNVRNSKLQIPLPANFFN